MTESAPRSAKLGDSGGSELVRVLLIGDIVGRPGRDAVQELVPRAREAWNLDAVIANVENSAAGSGITPKIHKELERAGIDIMTLGDHAWKRADNVEVFRKQPRVLRPHNYPDSAVGTGAGVFEVQSGLEIGIVTVLGRIFVEPVDSPFDAIERALASFPDRVRLRFIEIHAEATSEKIAVGLHFAGRASCVFGTHTHVQTADDRIFDGGTAYLSDLGMTGPYDGVIGRTASSVLHKFLTSMHARFTVASGDVHLCGALIEIDKTTGRAESIRRVDLMHGGDARPHSPLRPLGAEDLGVAPTSEA